MKISKKFISCQRIFTWNFFRNFFWNWKKNHILDLSRKAPLMLLGMFTALKFKAFCKSIFEGDVFQWLRSKSGERYQCGVEYEFRAMNECRGRLSANQRRLFPSLVHSYYFWTHSLWTGYDREYTLIINILLFYFTF